MKWIPGRQNSGYSKALLFEASWPLKFDVYVLKFPPGSQIRPHTDPVEGYRHFRANIILKRAIGGLFRVVPQSGIKSYIYRGRRLVIFRPDLIPHSVSEVLLDTRWVLSIGWLRR